MVFSSRKNTTKKTKMRSTISLTIKMLYHITKRRRSQKKVKKMGLRTVKEQSIFHLKTKEFVPISVASATKK